eukprot:9478272-Pyramimonas_sp.AAC.1
MEHDDPQDPPATVSDGAETVGSAESGRNVWFVFPGQGSQWVGMGRELYETEYVFRAAADAVDTQWRALAGWSLW